MPYPHGRPGAHRDRGGVSVDGSRQAAFPGPGWTGAGPPGASAGVSSWLQPPEPLPVVVLRPLCARWWVSGVLRLLRDGRPLEPALPDGSRDHVVSENPRSTWKINSHHGC